MAGGVDHAQRIVEVVGLSIDLIFALDVARNVNHPLLPKVLDPCPLGGILAIIQNVHCSKMGAAVRGGSKWPSQPEGFALGALASFL